MAYTFYPGKEAPANAEDYSRALKELHEKIKDVNKNITYLDIYNVVDVVIDKANFIAQVGGLGVCSSLIINTQPFFQNGTNYNTGDIIYKNSLGQTIHIKAQTGGVYYPSHITKNNNGNLNITYTYQSSAPTSEFSANENGISEYAKTITFNNLSTSDTTNTNIYGLWQKVSSFKIQRGKINTTDASGNETETTIIIQPQIQFWLIDSNTYPVEEICLDYALEQSDDEWQFTFLDNVDISNIYMKVK